jgi:hypothetical protein
MVLEHIRTLRAQNVSFQEIADQLNSFTMMEGMHHPRRGKRWTKQAVHRVLRRSA